MKIEKKNILFNEDKTSVFEFYEELFFGDAIPIIIAFITICYIITINFVYFKKINSNYVSSSYGVYSFFSSLISFLSSSSFFHVRHGFQSVLFSMQNLKKP